MAARNHRLRSLAAAAVLYESVPGADTTTCADGTVAG